MTPSCSTASSREEEIGKNLDHPGVMKVFTDDDRSQVYMVMEWVDGRLLRQILNEQNEAAGGARRWDHADASATRSNTFTTTAWCTAT